MAELDVSGLRPIKLQPLDTTGLKPLFEPEETPKPLSFHLAPGYQREIPKAVARGTVPMVTGAVQGALIGQDFLSRMKDDALKSRIEDELTRAAQRPEEATKAAQELRRIANLHLGQEERTQLFSIANEIATAAKPDVTSTRGGKEVDIAVPGASSTKAIAEEAYADVPALRERERTLPSEKQTFKTAAEIEKWWAERLKAAPGFEEDIPVMIAEGVGSMGGMMVTSLVTGGTGAFIQAGALGVKDQYDRGIKAGLTEKQALEQSVKGAGPGVLEAMSLEYVLRKIPPPARSTVVRAIKDVGEAMTAEALASMTAQVWQNAIESEYNPERNIFDGTLLEGGVSAGAAGVVRLAILGATRGKGINAPITEPEQQREEQEKAAREVIAEDVGADEARAETSPDLTPAVPQPAPANVETVNPSAGNKVSFTLPDDTVVRATFEGKDPDGNDRVVDEDGVVWTFAPDEVQLRPGWEERVAEADARVEEYLAGKREEARQQTPKLTEEDRASPIPNDLITQGREKIQDDKGTVEADRILKASGFAPVSATVQIRMEDGSVHSATVADAFESDGVVGARLVLEDGTAISDQIRNLKQRLVPITRQGGENVEEGRRQVQGGEPQRQEPQQADVEGGVGREVERSRNVQTYEGQAEEIAPPAFTLRGIPASAAVEPLSPALPGGTGDVDSGGVSRSPVPSPDTPPSPPVKRSVESIRGAAVATSAAAPVTIKEGAVLKSISGRDMAPIPATSGSNYDKWLHREAGVEAAVSGDMATYSSLGRMNPSQLADADRDRLNRLVFGSVPQAAQKPAQKQQATQAASVAPKPSVAPTAPTEAPKAPTNAPAVQAQAPKLAPRTVGRVSEQTFEPLRAELNSSLKTVKNAGSNLAFANLEKTRVRTRLKKLAADGKTGIVRRALEHIESETGDRVFGRDDSIWNIPNQAKVLQARKPVEKKPAPAASKPLPKKPVAASRKQAVSVSRDEKTTRLTFEAVPAEDSPLETRLKDEGWKRSDDGKTWTRKATAGAEGSAQRIAEEYGVKAKLSPLTKAEKASPQPATTKAWQDKQAKVAAEINAYLQSIGLREVRGVAGSIPAFKGNPVDALFLSKRKMREQGIDFPVIAVALSDTADYSKLVRHEAIHALRNLGLFTRSEWSALSRAANADKERTALIRDRYEGMNLSDATITEEVIADMFSEYNGGHSKPSGFIKSAFEKIKSFFKGLKNVLQGNGFKTASDIFADIEAGRIGGRPRREAEIRAALAAVQSVGSAGTSQNQVAATFRKVSFERGTVNLDIGGGRYETATAFMAEKGVKNLVYDPFNRSPEHNDSVLKEVAKNPPPTVTVNNVLNVIGEPDVRDAVIEHAAKTVDKNGTVYFLMYEGDKSGVKKITKYDKDGNPESLQNNLAAKEYIPEIQKHFRDVTRKGTLVIARDPGNGMLFAIAPVQNAAAQATQAMNTGSAAPQKLPRGTKRWLNDMNWFQWAAVYPRMIAALSNSFAPVYNTAKQQHVTREAIISRLGNEYDSYRKLSNESKVKVNKVLELGRLSSRTYNVNPNNGLTLTAASDTGLMKAGETVTLNKDEVIAYQSVRKMMDNALDLFRDQTIRDFGLDPAQVNTQQGVLALIQTGMNPNEAKKLRKLATILMEIKQSKRTGYVPFSRFGNAVVYVKDQNDNTLHSESIELTGLSGWASRKMGSDDLYKIKQVKEAVERLEAKYPNATVRAQQVALHPDPRKNIDIDVLSVMVQTPPGQLDALVKKFYDAALAKGFRKHFFGAKNIPGYSTDFERSMADYIIGMGGYLARRQFAHQWTSAINAIPSVREKEIRYAQKYQDYFNNPIEEYSGWRQAGFLYFIAGNLSTALVNTSQVPLFTAPYMTMFANPAKVTAELARAYKDVGLMFSAKRFVAEGHESFNPDKAPIDVRRALKQAWGEGEFTPMITFDIMGVASGRSQSARGWSAKARRARDAIAATYSAAERMNRIVTFIAAYRMAKSGGAGFQKNAERVLNKNDLAQLDVLGRNYSPEAFAKWVISETHFELGRMNRPVIGRGLGAAILQFKSFAMNALELQYRMAGMYGKRGKVAFGLHIMGLIAAGGIFAFPFGEDAVDLFEALYSWWTKLDVDVRTEVREIIAEVTDSPQLAGYMVNGSNRLLGIDATNRIGMGDLLPSTTSEAAGVPFSLTLQKVYQAATLAQEGRYGATIAELTPNFMKNIHTGLSWGEGGVRTRYGGVVMPAEEVTAADVLAKAVGFTPASISDVREMENAQQRVNTAARKLQDKFYSRIARYMAEAGKANEKGDLEAETKWNKKLEETFEELHTHNETAPPHLMIKLNKRALRDRLVAEYTGRGIVREQRAPKLARLRRQEIRELYEGEEAD